jgi:hypothetical protein
MATPIFFFKEKKLLERVKFLEPLLGKLSQTIFFKKMAWVSLPNPYYLRKWLG